MALLSTYLYYLTPLNPTFHFLYLSHTLGSGRLSPSEEIPGQERQMIYPNPSDGAFTVKEPGAFRYVVRSLSGNIVDQGTGTGEARLGTALPARVYIIRIESKSGTKEHKVVKH